MNYEINVARGGRHWFATADRSLTTRQEADECFDALVRAFPDCEVSMSLVERRGYSLRKWAPRPGGEWE